MLFRKAARTANPAQKPPFPREKDFIPTGTKSLPCRILLENTESVRFIGFPRNPGDLSERGLMDWRGDSHTLSHLPFLPIRSSLFSPRGFEIASSNSFIWWVVKEGTGWPQL